MVHAVVHYILAAPLNVPAITVLITCVRHTSDVAHVDQATPAVLAV
jgi:hypothetical protein